ncbi:hypothetical protein NW754_010748 [Fusarium falciforme]|uniref:Hypersensitive response-inducing protein n=1 Tax=Fusarium falciforme TaxID=195108 RepID=A0A9W8QUY2_9HYPO|nr:hypothetical protein NW754_010748 [Fusarium falciforme]KAJ4177306.1 hypothetical protein NW755_013928 [Fusarium falciforme]KAJ4184021.1 hypothetical protein NW767_013364 [Fusarium falciforme]KAJ4255328.1 hypothetical protein NW757_004843 [Fusarium falciforme]
MKFFIAAVLSATTVSASPVFTVSDFYAGCIPHSTQCSYSFGVIQPGTMEKTPVQCSIMLGATNGGNLPDVKDGECKESSRTFNVVRSRRGLTLTVSQPVTPSSNQTGEHFIPNKQIVTSKEPNAMVQTYKGPKNFDLN